MANDDFYRGKKVLCVGGAGLVGSHLVEQLLDRGASVTVLDNLSRGKRENLPELYKERRFGFVYGDCTREGTCRDALKDIDYVFNLAAHVAGVDYNQSHHFEMFTRNLATQLMPLRVANEYGIEKFLNVSSVCVYAPEHNSPAIEENGLIGNPTKANAGYSWSKRMGEHLAIWSQIPVVRVRPSNVFGPRDYFDERAHVIPRLIMQCLNDRPYITVHGSGQTFREFIYVDDVAAGMIAALERGTAGEAYNLGTNGRTKINTRDLLRMIQRLTGAEKEWRQADKKVDTGDLERWTNSDKIEALGWKATTGLEKGLDAAIKWYRAR